MALPRPALLPNVPLGCILEHLFVFVKDVEGAICNAALFGTIDR